VRLHPFCYSLLVGPSSVSATHGAILNPRGEWTIAYAKVTLEVVVRDDDVEIAIQAMNDVMDSIEEKEKLTVYESTIRTAPDGEPVNANEITARA
jgi:hypothetical protein